MIKKKPKIFVVKTGSMDELYPVYPDRGTRKGRGGRNVKFKFNSKSEFQKMIVGNYGNGK